VLQTLYRNTLNEAKKRSTRPIYDMSKFEGDIYFCKPGFGQVA